MSVPTRRHDDRRAVQSASGVLPAPASNGAAHEASPGAAVDPAATHGSSPAEPNQPFPGPEPDARLGLAFPEGFGWGAATSAYQIEGATKDDGRGESVWDTFSHTPGKTRNGDTGDIAVDHYHRYPQDLDLMRDLGLRSYRFSISWPRIQADGTGAPNQRGLDFYRRLVDGLHERGIEPMATLFHWDTPQALQDKGGWASRATAYRFADYAEAVYAALGDAVPVWLTINEPKTVVQNGYIQGHHAPGLHEESLAYQVAHHLQLAHGLAVQRLRGMGGNIRIGPAFNLHPCYPADDTPEALAATRLFDGYENRLYLDSALRGHYPADVLADQGPDSPFARSIQDGDLEIIHTPIDLLAVQYYTPLYIKGDGSTEQRHATTKAFWQQIYPEGMYDILTRVHRDYGPVSLTVTENGLPCPDVLGPENDIDDVERVAFLRDHFAAAHRAIADGVPLESYHVWSLLDNFEWDQGYEERWGLVYVDYTTQQRILKRSARWYQRVIAENAV
ncbi:GH1 family beta-glucosidase [Micromonospora sp. CPCC 206061]|uniref:GH1 family beta-glucosidase n=1 Tax=Micromonospora sp. CPCC 206061 TaxID=3122410 RepID=UPI002FF3FBC4